MAWTLGIDVAVRAEHQAALARDGATVWRGRKFSTRPTDLQRLWSDLDLADPGELTVVVEPTRNAWIVLAEWFRRHGARVVMVPTTQSADLRKYYSKHTKNDRIDSELLARLPLAAPRRTAGVLRAGARRSVAAAGQAALHDGQTPGRGLRPARRAGRAARAGLVRGARLELRRRSVGVPCSLCRPERGDPARPGASEPVPDSPVPWRVARGPRRRAHRSRPERPSRCGDRDGMNFAELADDIAHEAEQALFLTRQIKQIDERVANLYADADPAGIVASAPGVGAVISAVIAGRIGDPHRFTSLAAIRAYTGLVPKVSQSGVSKAESSITKAGDPLLREMLCTAADQARKVDPQFAAKYQRLMAGDRHHESAICHLATHARHPDRGLHAHRPAVRPAGRRRHADHRGRGPGDRQGALQDRPAPARQRPTQADA